MAREPLAFIDLKRQQARIRPQLDRAIAGVLAHGSYVMGPEIRQLESELAKFTGAKVSASRFTLAATDNDTFTGAVLTNNFMPDGRLQAQGPSDGK